MVTGTSGGKRCSEIYAVYVLNPYNIYFDQTKRFVVPLIELMFCDGQKCEHVMDLKRWLIIKMMPKEDEEEKQ